MKVLTSAALAAAEEFMQLNARLVDRRMFAYHFRGGSPEAVLTALRAYGNADGGFGNALEPDLRGPGSQPQPVEVALRALDEIDSFDDPMVTAACDYLETITADNGGVPFVLPSVRDTPRAPWWQTDDDPPGALNPTAAIAGLLHKHQVRHPWLERATAFCFTAIEELGGAEQPRSEQAESGESRESRDGRAVRPDPYTGRAIMPFLDHVPARDRAAKAFDMVHTGLLAGVTLDPRATGEVHFPLEFAPVPGGFAGRLFSGEIIDQHLDTLIDAQDEDGGWTPNFPFWNPVNAFEWRGFVTVRQLVTLRAYGRIAAE